MKRGSRDAGISVFLTGSDSFKNLAHKSYKKVYLMIQTGYRSIFGYIREVQYAAIHLQTQWSMLGSDRV